MIPAKSHLAEIRLLSVFRDVLDTVVEEYRFVSNNNQIQLFLYRNGSLQGQQQLPSTEMVIADRIRQLVIYSSDGSTPIYMADGVADGESTIKTEFQAGGSVQLDFRLRLPIVFGHYQLRLKLKQTNSGPVFREMRIATFRLRPDQTPHDVKEEEIKYGSATDPKDSFLPSQINSIIDRFIPTTIPLELEKYVTTSGNVVTETNSFFNEIGLVLAEPNERITFETEFRFAGHSAMMPFPANQTTAKKRVYMPLVRVNLGRQLDSFYTNPLTDFPPLNVNKGVVHLKGLGRAPRDGSFVSDPRHTIRFEQKYGDRFINLWLSQYPSPDSLPRLLSFAPQPKVRESLIIIEKVPANVVQEYWNEEIAAEYYKQSEEVSFLPKFISKEDFAEAHYWNLTYLTRLTHERLFTKFRFYSQVDGSGFSESPVAAEVKIKWLSFHPQRGYKARVSFDKLLTHANKGLEGVLSLKPPTETSPEISSPEITKSLEQFSHRKFGGFNLIFDGPIEMPKPNYSATVRIGALDLTFSSFTDSVTPAPGPPDNANAKDNYFAFQTRFFEDNLIRVFANDIPFRVAAVDAGGQDDLPLNFFAAEEQTVSIQSPCAISADDRAARQQLKTDLEASSSAAKVREWIEKYERPIEAHYLRETPLVVAVKKNTPLPDKAPYQLSVDESRLEKLQRTIRLRLAYLVDQAGNAPSLIDLKAVVLDKDPLLVAKVEFPADVLRKHEKEVELAVWTNASNEGKRWKLNSSAAPFEIVLPPQAIGEEMEKYGNILPPPLPPPPSPPPPEPPVDFRLGPPAEIRVSASGSTPLQEFGTALQNYTEPPWNLRRLLGYPGQRDPGLWVQHIQFELLYGLSCEVDYPYLRLAEITSLLGMIPGRLAMPQSNQNKYSDDKKALANFLLARFDWAVVNRRYQSRIGLILPWNTRPVESLAAETDQKGSAKDGGTDGKEKKASSTTFLIQKNAQCFIRREAREPLPNATASPDPSGLPPADLKSPVDSDSHGGVDGGLAGGAVWGLESKNIFDAIMRLDETKPDLKYPRSDRATTILSDLIFSSFGGWGKVSAPFDNRRSKIYANVSMGRTFTYEVERIGRIAVFWNRAKHVIVYERTVVPSKQMAPYQGAHLGRPIIRKVREYVEILEDVRSYPEKLPDRQVLQTELGFIEACDFLKKGQQFNVLSFWGGDVGAQGWKVPLWNQAAEPKEVYPKPRIALQIQVRSENDEPGKKTRTERCFIQNPENIFFYTSTLPGETDDTDIWKPVVGVDLVDVPKCEPLTDFEGGNNVQTTPDDPVVHPGYGPVTFLLEPNSPPANLIAGKSGEPMSAVLRSVSMMRGRPLDAPDSINEGALKQIAFLRKDLALKFQELLNQIPVDRARAEAEIVSIKEQLKAKVDAIPLLNNFGEQLKGVKTRFTEKAKELETRLADAEAKIFSTAQERLNRIDNDFHASGILHQLREEYASLRKIVQAGQLTKLQFADAVERQLRKLQEGLTLVEISPGGLLRNIEQIIVHFQQAKNELKKWNDFLGSISAGTVPAARLEEIRQIIVAFTELTDRIISSTQTGTLRSPMDWLPDAFVGTSDKFFPEFEKRYAALKSQQIKTALEKIVAGTLQKADIESLTTKIFDETDATSLMSAFKRAEINTFLDDVNSLRTSLDKLTNPKLVGGWLFTQEQELLNFVNTQQGNVADQLRLLDALSSRVSKDLSDARHILNQYSAIRDFVIAKQKILLPVVLDGAKKNIDEIHDFIKGKIDAGNVIEKGLKAKIDEISSDIRSGVEALRSEILEKTDAFVESAVRALPRVGDKPYVIADTAPRLIRAFGEPPKVPNLTFQRPVLAYFYNEGSKAIDLSPVISRVAQANEIINAAKPLGIDLPTINILERLVPKGLEAFDLSSILPNIAGLDLKDLFSGIKLPKSATDKVTITHGFDIQARRAWVKALIHDIEISKRATVFSIGPLEFVLNKAIFTAEMRFEAAKDEQPKKSIKGQIYGDWEVIVGGVKILVIERTALSFDESGKLKFDIKIKNVKLPEVLAFVSDLLSFTSADGGLSFRVTKEKVEALLNLPVPPIMAGVSGISNLHLSVAFRLFFSPVFKIATSFSFGGKLKPFNTTAFVLSGGGYIEVEANYVPSLHAIGCAVEIGLALGARLGIALGPINGSVFIYFGIYVRYQVSPGDAQNAGLRIGVTYLIGGEVNVLGLVSAGISLLLDASYLHGKLTGRGQLSIHIKICWCFTLEIEEEVEYTVGSGSGGGGSAQIPRRNDLRQVTGPARFLNASYKRNHVTKPAPQGADPIDPARILLLAGDYVQMLS